MASLRIQPRAKQWIEEKGISHLTIRQTSAMPGCCSSGAIELLAEPGVPSREEGFQKANCQGIEIFIPRPLFDRLSSPCLTLQHYGLFKSLRLIDPNL